MGVVALPSRVTGLRAISIIEEITFIPGCQASSNSSHPGLWLGDAWRRILKTTDSESAMVRIVGLCHVQSRSCSASEAEPPVQENCRQKPKRRFVRNEKADCRIF